MLEITAISARDALNDDRIATHLALVAHTPPDVAVAPLDADLFAGPASDRGYCLRAYRAHNCLWLRDETPPRPADCRDGRARAQRRSSQLRRAKAS
jgi:hypothetical protein